MLRPKFQEEILIELSRNPFFSSTDFALSLKEKKLTIKCNSAEEYYFSFQIPSASSSPKSDNIIRTKGLYVFYCTISPWRTAKVESSSFNGKASLLKGISDWVNYLEEDIVCIITNRKFKKLEEDFSKYKNRIDDFENTYFTSEEASDFEDKLSKLEEQMCDRISKLEKDSRKQKEMIENLKKEMDAIRVKAGAYDKKQLFTAVLGKIYDWAKNPQNGILLANGITTIQNMIGGG